RGESLDRPIVGQVGRVVEPQLGCGGAPPAALESEDRERRDPAPGARERYGTSTSLRERVRPPASRTQKYTPAPARAPSSRRPSQVSACRPVASTPRSSTRTTRPCRSTIESVLLPAAGRSYSIRVLERNGSGTAPRRTSRGAWISSPRPVGFVLGSTMRNRWSTVDSVVSWKLPDGQRILRRVTRSA